VVNERHLKRLLSEYIPYFHEDRTHLGLKKETPGRRVAAAARAPVTALPRFGGIHHYYDAWPRSLRLSLPGRPLLTLQALRPQCGRRFDLVRRSDPELGEMEASTAPFNLEQDFGGRQARKNIAKFG
jgi:hypothetical protein